MVILTSNNNNSKLSSVTLIMDSKCFVFLVCDDIIAYKFIEDKALKWLKSKVHNTSEFLKSEDITGSEASVSSNFTKSVTTETKE